MTRKSHRNNRKRRQSGGMLNAGYGVTTQGVIPGSPFYGIVDGSVGGCQAVAPSYALPASAAAAFKGLPGMNGGGRRRRRRRTMKGGRYSGIPSAYDGPVIGNTPMATRIACEAGQGTPQPSPTVPTEPAVVSASAPAPAPAGGFLSGLIGFFKGGRRTRSKKMRGGALTAPYSGGTPLEETTAGYSHFAPSQGGGAVVQTQSGVPFMINQPGGGRLGESNACLTMGGTANPNIGNTMKGGKRNRRRSHRRR